MWAKVIGALLVTGAGAGVGWQLAQPLSRRPEELRQIQAGLSLLETEIGYGAVPLPEALGRAAAAGGAARRLFGRAAAACDRAETPAAALQMALGAFWAGSALAPPDREALAGLAAVLGASDRQDQIRHLRLCRERLRAAEAAAEADRLRYERLYRHLGLLGGLAAAILLL
ncbi:MAG: stage III sporulation protein AB [Firmicutes bacterium]|nr:stage III sporulation protein AB [Bacillota bacterium]